MKAPNCNQPFPFSVAITKPLTKIDKNAIPRIVILTAFLQCVCLILAMLANILECGSPLLAINSNSNAFLAAFNANSHIKKKPDILTI